MKKWNLFAASTKAEFWMFDYIFAVSLSTLGFLYYGDYQYSGNPAPPIVTVTNGTIQGGWYEGAAIFLGIPFAKPPIGPLRFQNPQSYGKWDSPLRAISFKNACIQAGAHAKMFEVVEPDGTSEDCLYLNIMTPQIKPKKALPVMLFIHGGGFLSGNAPGYTRIVQHWVSKGVVVVTIQYRLNVFGFFTTETEEFPSNLAMMDQIAAMKWVRTEISAFGGDPNRVTILGESAGSFSVSLHTFSPLSRPFFQQALEQSGTGYSPWALYGNQNRYHNASKVFALATKCITEKEWESKQFAQLKLCIQKLSAAQIWLIREVSVPEIGATHFRTSTLGMNWAPRVGTAEGFLPESLEKLSQKRSKNMPVIVGTARNEMFSWTLDSGKFTIFNKAAFEKAVSNYGSEKTWGTRAKAVQKVLRQCYMPKNSSTSPIPWFWAIEELESGYVFFSGARKEAETLLQTSANVYAYSFDYLPPSGWPKYKNHSIKGVSHGAIQAYEFGNGNQEVAEIIARLWTNFAKTGNPNKPLLPKAPWKPFTSYHPNFYSITKNSRTLPSYHSFANHVWNNLIPNAPLVKNCSLNPALNLDKKPHFTRFMRATQHG